MTGSAEHDASCAVAADAHRDSAQVAQESGVLLNHKRMEAMLANALDEVEDLRAKLSLSEKEIGCIRPQAFHVREGMKLALAPRMSAGAAERALEGRLHETAASMARTSAVRAREALGTCLVEATLDLCQFECDRLERARDAALLQLTKTAAVATEWERRCRDARQEVATASQRAKEQGAEILRLESALREAKAAATAAADEHARAMGEAGAAHRAAADAMRAEAEGRVRKAEAERARAVAEKDAERRAAVEALEAKLRDAEQRCGDAEQRWRLAEERARAAEQRLSDRERFLEEFQRMARENKGAEAERLQEQMRVMAEKEHLAEARLLERVAALEDKLRYEHRERQEAQDRVRSLEAELRRAAMARDAEVHVLAAQVRSQDARRASMLDAVREGPTSEALRPQTTRRTSVLNPAPEHVPEPLRPHEAPRGVSSESPVAGNELSGAREPTKGARGGSGARRGAGRRKVSERRGDKGGSGDVSDGVGGGRDEAVAVGRKDEGSARGGKRGGERAGSESAAEGTANGGAKRAGPESAADGAAKRKKRRVARLASRVEVDEEDAAEEGGQESERAAVGVSTGAAVGGQGAKEGSLPKVMERVVEEELPRAPVAAERDAVDGGEAAEEDAEVVGGLEGRAAEGRGKAGAGQGKRVLGRSVLGELDGNRASFAVGDKAVESARMRVAGLMAPSRGAPAARVEASANTLSCEFSILTSAANTPRTSVCRGSGWAAVVLCPLLRQQPLAVN